MRVVVGSIGFTIFSARLRNLRWQLKSWVLSKLVEVRKFVVVSALDP